MTIPYEAAIQASVSDLEHNHGYVNPSDVRQCVDVFLKAMQDQGWIMVPTKLTLEMAEAGRIHPDDYASLIKTAGKELSPEHT